MRTLTPTASTAALSALPDVGPHGPRVVVAGNHAVPWEVLRLLDDAVPALRLIMLNPPLGCWTVTASSWRHPSSCTACATARG